jgi:hypothetical protein
LNKISEAIGIESGFLCISSFIRNFAKPFLQKAFKKYQLWKTKNCIMRKIFTLTFVLNSFLGLISAQNTHNVIDKSLKTPIKFLFQFRKAPERI